MVPLERVELVSQDMDLIADVLRQIYVEHAATFRCADPDRVDGNVRSVMAGGLVAGLLRYGGVQYTAELSPAGAPLVVAARRGSGVITTAREELRFLPGRRAHGARRHAGRDHDGRCRIRGAAAPVGGGGRTGRGARRGARGGPEVRGDGARLRGRPA